MCARGESCWFASARCSGHAWKTSLGRVLEMFVTSMVSGWDPCGWGVRIRTWSSGMSGRTWWESGGRLRMPILHRLKGTHSVIVGFLSIFFRSISWWLCPSSCKCGIPVCTRRGWWWWRRRRLRPPTSRRWVERTSACSSGCTSRGRWEICRCRVWCIATKSVQDVSGGLLLLCPICIVFGLLLRITEDFMCSLNSLELGRDH
jgi:hypothetical protein